MQALVLENCVVRIVDDYPRPSLRPGWASIRPRLMGICRTDVELARGYKGFSGVLGHELVGDVVEASSPGWVGRRVVAAINVSCGACARCRQGAREHCETRRVLGIDGLDGCFAELTTLPLINLLEVPAALSDAEAVFAEPLAAAYRILEQVEVAASDRCVVLGDGKLGILCAWVLSTVSRHVWLVGRHRDKLRRAELGAIRRVSPPEPAPQGADLVVDATGSPSGLRDALAICRPRGTVVLKSTLARDVTIDLSPLVVDEVRVVGSRCGPLDCALDGLARHRFPVGRLIDRELPLSRADEALELASRRGVLKVLITGPAGASKR